MSLQESLFSKEAELTIKMKEFVMRTIRIMFMKDATPRDSKTAREKSYIKIHT